MGVGSHHRAVRRGTRGQFLVSRNLNEHQFPVPGAWDRAHESHVRSLREQALTDLYHVHRYRGETMAHSQKIADLYQQSHDRLMTEAASHEPKTCAECKEYVDEEARFGPW